MHSENIRDLILEQLVCWAKGTNKRTQNRNQQNNKELLGWEEKRKICLKEQLLLKGHRIPHSHPDSNSKQAA